MSDNNIINLSERSGRVGFKPPSAMTSANIPPRPVDPPIVGLDQPSGRKSPLETLATLHETGLPQPVTPLPVTPPPGFIPPAFRSDPSGGSVAPRLGALSLAAVLAVSVAALRGIHSALTTRKANRTQRDTVKDMANKANASQGGGAGKTKVPPSHEYARKSLGRTGGGANSGSGPSKNRKSPGPENRKSSGAGSGPGRQKSNTTDRGSGRGDSRPNSKRDRSKTRRDNTKPHKGPKGFEDPKERKQRKQRKPNGSVHRSSQGGAATKHGSGKGGGKRKTDHSKHNTPHDRTRAPKGTTGPKGTLRPKKDKKHNKNHKQPQSSGRTNLTGAVKDGLNQAAGERLKRRRKNKINPPIWTDSPKKNKKDNKKKDHDSQKSTAASSKTTNSGKKGSGPGKPDNKSGKKTTRPNGKGPKMHPWHKAAKKATKKTIRGLHKRWDKRRKTMSGPPPGGPKTSSGPKASTRRPGTTKDAGKRYGRQASGWANDQWAKVYGRARRRWNKRRPGRSTSGTGSGPYGTGPYTQHSSHSHGHTAGGKRRRRTVWQSAGMATPTTITVTRAEAAQAVTTGQHALPRAPENGTPRPGTTAPEKREEAMSHPAPVPPGVPDVPDEPMSEITVDDCLKDLGKLKDLSTDRYDGAVALARNCRTLLHALDQKEADLRSRHNVKGPRTTTALTFLKESVELMARKADELARRALIAADLTEVAHIAMRDKYKPTQLATADAGLATPSARSHNQ